MADDNDTIWIVSRDIDASQPYLLGANPFRASIGPICALLNEEEADEFAHALEREIEDLIMEFQNGPLTEDDINFHYINEMPILRKYDPTFPIGLIRAINQGLILSIFYPVHGMRLVHYFPDNWR